MEKSPSIIELAQALTCFQGKMGKIKKDANNPFFKSKYASLGNILEAIQEPLSECGLCFSQFPTDSHGLTTILMHAKSGEYLQATYFMKPVKDDPQGIGSSITYQRRYSLSAILGLNIDEDDDGNTASRPKTVAEPTTAEKVNNMVKQPAQTLSIDELEQLRDSLKLVNDVSELGKFFNQLPKDTQTDKGALALLGDRKKELNKLQLA